MSVNPTRPPEGLLLLDKPAGITSFECVRRVRDKLNVKRVGHCGTLDPLAEGLMMILVGSATRAQDTFLGLEKTYWFRAEFGRRTITGDLEGSVVESEPYEHITESSLRTVLTQFIGTHDQLPPLYAALKYKGAPYYAYARKGVEIPRTPRSVTISTLSLLRFDLPYWEARVVCSRGTYVRVLAEDVASRLGSCGVLVKLIREQVGAYTRDSALRWTGFLEGTPQEIISCLHPLSH